MLRFIRMQFNYVFLILVLFSCGEAKKQPIESLASSQVNHTIESDFNKVKSDSIVENTQFNEEEYNLKDSQGRKQGKWITMLNGKPWKIEFYKDNKLHGQCFNFWANGEVMRMEYEHGKRHGYYLHYQPDSTVARFVVYYQNDTAIWHGFPSELALYFIPIKGFSSEIDSVYVKVPYVSGNLMYEGWVKNNKNNQTVPIREHKVYFESGKLQAKIDYALDTMIIYNSKEEIQKTSKIWFRTLVQNE